MMVLPFLGSAIPALCHEILSLIILAFLVNLLDTAHRFLKLNRIQMSETLGWNRVDFVLTPMLDYQAGRGFFICSEFQLLKQKGDIYSVA